MNNIVLDKDSFIHELSEKCGYGIGDTRNFLNALIEFMGECILNGIEINVRGFGRMYIQTLPSRRGFQPIRGQKGKGEYKDYPEAQKVIFKLSKNLRDLLKMELVEDSEEEV
jgi:nucleoid DNA-binding protein